MSNATDMWICTANTKSCCCLIYSVVLMERCKPSLKWLNTEALTMMGPYLSHLAPDDVDCSPKEKVTGFCKEGQRAIDSRKSKSQDFNLCLCLFPWHSLLAVYFFQLSPVQIRLECGHQDEPQPGHEVSPKISGMLQWNYGVCRARRQVCIHAYVCLHSCIKILNQIIASQS